MKFFTTPKQREILQNYWSTHKPFTANDLFSAGLVRFVQQGNFLIRCMKQKHQIICCPDMEKRYIGTTESKEEWQHLKREAGRFRFMSFVIIDEGIGIRGLNRYELAELAGKMIAMIQKRIKIQSPKKGFENSE